MLTGNVLLFTLMLVHLVKRVSWRPYRLSRKGGKGLQPTEHLRVSSPAGYRSPWPSDQLDRLLFNG
eukprot:4818374-Pyramimonas_sp.AAC.1